MKTYFRVFFKDNTYVDVISIYKKDDTISTINSMLMHNDYSLSNISAISHFIMYPSGKFDRTEISINKL